MAPPRIGREAAIVLLTLCACTPPRSRPEAPSSPSGGPEIHGEIRMRAGGLAAQESPGAQDLTADFEVPPGFAVTLFAESPQLHNPTAIDVDHRGRVWVAEGVNYRQWDGRNPGLRRPEGDRIVILEDEDGDGDSDSSKVFVQDRELVAPLGIAVIGSARNPGSKRVVVSCSPAILVYTDEDGDDRPEKREVFLTGFGGRDHDHGLHSVVVGPDGRWYFAVGNAGPHVVQDRGGWTLRSGSIYRGGGAAEADNHPGLVSDDGKVWTGGLILRCESDGTKLAVMAHNFRNEYEVALDSFGNMFTSDNDDDGNQCCRTVWVMEGGNYGYFSQDGAREWPADRRPGQDVWAAHWHQDDPGVCPPGTRNGAGGPTGVAVYEGDLFGPQWMGVVLNCDAGANCVYAHTPVAKGAGCELRPGTLLRSKPRGADERSARWFRPSDVCVATDGSAFVSDWWDPGVGGHLAGDPAAYGRILRVAPRGSRLHAPRIDLSTAERQAEALKNPAVSVRQLGFEALRAQGDGALPTVEPLLGDLSPWIRARALWLLSRTGEAGRRRLLGVMKDADPQMAVAAFRALRQWSELPIPGRPVSGAPPEERRRHLEARGRDLLLHAGWRAKDASLSVPREAAIALREFPASDAGPQGWSEELAALLVERYPPGDRWYLEALGGAFEARAAEWFAWLDGKYGGDPLAWPGRFADLAWRLHPPAAVPAFAARARARDLTPAARRQAVDALAFVRERSAGEAMLDLALAGPEDVRPLAAWWIEHNDLDLWREHRLAAELGPRGLAGAVMRWSSGIRASGSAEVDVDVTGSKKLWLVVDEGKLGNGCDWADWIDPVFSGPGGEVRLTSLDWTSANAAWGETRKHRNAGGGPLRFEGAEIRDGIGTHARSEIAFTIPEGSTRFRARAALDDGGTTQQGGRPELEFQVWTDEVRDPGRWKAHERTLVDGTAPAEEVDAAARTMAADREGGLALLQLASAKRLSPAGSEAAARYIFASPDLSIRALASEHFPRPPAARPSPAVDEVLGMNGNPARGVEIFFGDVARCSTCHRYHGKGADIGPDLSAITAKYGRPQILDAILNPSAAIAFGYDTFVVETADGRVENGFLLSEGEQVLLKDTSGRRHVIPSAEIVSKTKQRVSTMPDNAATGLAAQELSDLLAFLSRDPRAPGRRLEPRSLFDGKSLEGWTCLLDEPGAKLEDVWSVKDGVLRCKGRPTGYLRTTEDFANFVLTLEWRFDPTLGAGNSGVLVRMTGADKIWPRSIEAQLNSGDAGDIWNIDEVPAEVDPSRTRGRRTIKLAPSSEKPLGEWNRYVITLDGGELALEVNGVKQNEARWVEEIPGKICLQSEGAAIEFRRVEIVPILR